LHGFGLRNERATLPLSLNKAASRALEVSCPSNNHLGRGSIDLATAADSDGTDRFYKISTSHSNIDTQFLSSRAIVTSLAVKSPPMLWLSKIIEM
jgi:hypothetical protein